MRMAVDVEQVAARCYVSEFEGVRDGQGDGVVVRESRECCVRGWWKG